MRSLSNVLSTKQVPRLLLSMVVGRLPTGMAALAIVLVTRAHGAGYAVAGVLAGVYAASQAVGAPVLARAVDRWRQSPVLLGSAAASAVGFFCVGVLDVGSQVVPAAAAVALAGFATPPLEPCLRVLWSDLLRGADVQAAYSLDTAMQELIFTFGPLVVLGCVAVFGPAGGLFGAAVLCLAGTVVFASAAPSRRWRGEAVVRHWAGPLRSAALIRLLCAVAFVGLTIGTFTVAITGHAEAVSTRSSAAWFIAANAFGALIGGVANTAVRPSRDPSRRLLWLLLALALGYLPLILAPGVAGTLPLAFVSGIALPSVLATAMVLVDSLAPAGTVTEAFAWVVTAFGAGFALGSALAGVALDGGGYRVAVVGGLVGAGLVIVRLTSPAVVRSAH